MTYPEQLRATSVEIAAQLRRRAVNTARDANVYQQHGLHHAAMRRREAAAGMLEMARLTEAGPFEVGVSGEGAGVLVAHLTQQRRAAA